MLTLILALTALGLLASALGVIQYIREGTEPVMASPLLSTQTIAKGDLLVINLAGGTPANGVMRMQDVPWDTNLATTQADAVNSTSFAFVGISAQDMNNPGAFGQTSQTMPYGNSLPQIRVNTDGVFDCDCASNSTFTIGQRVGPAKASGNALVSQTVVAVGHDSIAIGRVVEYAAGVSKVRVAIMPALLPQSNPGIAPL